MAGWIALLLLAAVAGTLLTRRVLGWADGRIVDLPNERSSHVRPTPRGGGLAIVAVVLGGTALYSAATGAWLLTWPFLAGGALVAGISFVDDVRTASSGSRFIIQCLAALIAVGGLTTWQVELLPFGAVLPAAGILLAFLWVVGLTNAYNFMDGIDGIAGTQAVVGGLAWAVIGLLIGSPVTTLIALLLAGAALGFLHYNWPPARIFMGDVGSAFLGFSFAIMPAVSGATRPGMLAAASLISGVFVFDALLTFVRRLLNGEKVFEPHRSHLYQRLASGRTHGSVTLLYGGLGAVAAAAAVLALLLPERAVLIWFATAGTIGLTLWLVVAGHERTAGRRPRARRVEIGT
jgi:Fuc2NAc and GlcNAc transferase